MDISITVMTYNIHEARSFFFKRNIEQNIWDVLLKYSPDIVCLQEVREYHDPAREFGNSKVRKTWGHYIYGRNSEYSSWSKGNAVLSRYPILNWHNRDVSIASAESRSSLEVEIYIPGIEHPLKVVNLHFGLRRWERRTQVQNIVSYCSYNICPEQPCIFAGDFNEWRPWIIKDLSSELKLTDAFYSITGKHAKTFPAVFPMFSLDHIFFTNCRAHSATAHSEVGWRGLPDHIPLSAEFRL